MTGYSRPRNLAFAAVLAIGAVGTVSAQQPTAPALPLHGWRVDDTHLRVIGDLTLRGVTKTVTLDTEITGIMNGQRARRIAFTATTMIGRTDFGVAFNRLVEGAQVVGEEVRITIDIEAVQPIG